MTEVLNISIIRILAQTMGYTALWGSIIILLAFIVLHLNAEKAPSWKTKWILGTMLSIVGLMFTFFCLEFTSALKTMVLISEGAVGESQINLLSLTSILPSAESLVDYKDVLIWTWFLGVLVLMTRFILNYFYAKYIKKNAVWNDHPKWGILIANVSNKLSYNPRKLKLGFSKLIDSPMVIGFAKPIILFPIGLINNLSTKEVESVLAHEIAHLARRDHLISGIMAFLEVVLYFHPGIWWLNAQMKKYREEDCDDRAIAVTGDELTYVKTLVKLKEYNKHTPNDLMLALNGGSKSNFYNRIKRLLNMDVKSKSIKGQLLVLSSIIILGLFFTSSTLLSQEKNEAECEVEETLEEFVNSNQELEMIEILNTETHEVSNDTLPKKKSHLKIHKKENDEEVELEMEDGEIIELKINGETVPEKEYEEHNIIIKELKDIDEDGQSLWIIDKDKNGKKSFKLKDSNIFILGEDSEGTSGYSFSIGSKLDSLLPEMHRIDSLISFSFGDFPTNFETDFPRMDMKIFNGEDLEHFELNEDKLQELLKSAERFSFPDGEHSTFWFDSDGDFEFDDNHFRIFESEEHPKWLNDNHGHHKLFDRSERNLESLIGSQLNKDGFLIPNKENKVLLTGKYLKINGEKQPSNIWNKYKRLFEQETGVPLRKKSRLEFSIIGKESNKRYKAF